MSSSSEEVETEFAQEHILPHYAAKGWMNRLSHTRLWLLATGFAVVSFASKEILYSVIVKDVGRRDERYLAEALSSLLLGWLLAKLLESVYELRRAMVARVQVAAELNHHIRNAMQVIVFHCRPEELPQGAIEQITQSLHRVDWALREILPAPVPRMAPARSVEENRKAGAGKR